MSKVILLTGATDGIGLATARLLAAQGHQLLIHGRNPDKLASVKQELAEAYPNTSVTALVADLSSLDEVRKLAEAVKAQVAHLDVIINNAGVFKTPSAINQAGLDVRFVVNTLAPWLLTRALLPLMPADGRVVNLSSAAQAPVQLDALQGEVQLADDFAAYAQSKLAITAWSRALAKQLGDRGPAIIAVNPGSLLASKMVKDGFGVAGNDISIGANILIRAGLDASFADASGKYFDNDSGKFAPPHPAALDEAQTDKLLTTMDAMLGLDSIYSQA